MNIEEMLKKLRDYEKEQNKLRGQLDALKAQLKSEFDFESFEDATDQLQKMKDTQKQMTDDLVSAESLLEEKCQALRDAGIKI